MPRPVHEISRILAVVDGELRIKPKSGRIFAQEPRAKAMERACIGRRRRGGGLRRETAGEQAFDAPTKLSRRTARKSREHDALRIGAGENERRHAMRKHRRLARAGAGDDEQRPRTLRIADPMLDRELLLGIEIDGRGQANQSERHGSTQPCFALCSQGRIPFRGARRAFGRDPAANSTQPVKANGGNTRVSPSLCTA